MNVGITRPRRGEAVSGLRRRHHHPRHGDSRITRAAYSLHSRGLIAYMTYRRRALLWLETVRDPCVFRHGEPRGRLRRAEATEYRLRD
jgi:hypothetical protein